MMGRTEYEVEITALAAIDRKIGALTAELTALGVEAP